MPKKTRKNITIDVEILSWVEQQIQSKRFASVSHAVEYALEELRRKKT